MGRISIEIRDWNQDEADAVWGKLSDEEKRKVFKTLMSERLACKAEIATLAKEREDLRVRKNQLKFMEEGLRAELSSIRGALLEAGMERPGNTGHEFAETIRELARQRKENFDAANRAERQLDCEQMLGMGPPPDVVWVDEHGREYRLRWNAGDPSVGIGAGYECEDLDGLVIRISDLEKEIALRRESERIWVEVHAPVLTEMIKTLEEIAAVEPVEGSLVGFQDALRGLPGRAKTALQEVKSRYELAGKGLAGRTSGGVGPGGTIGSD